MEIFSLQIFLPHTINSAVGIIFYAVGSLQTLRLNGGQRGRPLSKLNCFTPLRVKKIDSKGPFFWSKGGNNRFAGTRGARLKYNEVIMHRIIIGSTFCGTFYSTRSRVKLQGGCGLVKTHAFRGNVGLQTKQPVDNG